VFGLPYPIIQYSGFLTSGKIRISIASLIFYNASSTINDTALLVLGKLFTVPDFGDYSISKRSFAKTSVPISFSREQI